MITRQRRIPKERLAAYLAFASKPRIHPLATIAQSAETNNSRVGIGSYVGKNSNLFMSTIGDNVIAGPNSQIKFANVGNGCSFLSDVKVEGTPKAFIEIPAGVILKQHARICPEGGLPLVVLETNPDGTAKKYAYATHDHADRDFGFKVVLVDGAIEMASTAFQTPADFGYFLNRLLEGLDGLALPRPQIAGS